MECACLHVNTAACFCPFHSRVEMNVRRVACARKEHTSTCIHTPVCHGKSSNIVIWTTLWYFFFWCLAVNCFKKILTFWTTWVIMTEVWFLMNYPFTTLKTVLFHYIWELNGVPNETSWEPWSSNSLNLNTKTALSPLPPPQLYLFFYSLLLCKEYYIYIFY